MFDIFLSDNLILNRPASDVIWDNKIMVDNLIEIIMTLPSTAASAGALRTRYLIACKTDEKSQRTNKGIIIPIIPNYLYLQWH